MPAFECKAQSLFEGSATPEASIIFACCICTCVPFLALQMLVDDIGDFTITNDGATILKQLEVEHPAAKVRFQLHCSLLRVFIISKIINVKIKKAEE